MGILTRFRDMVASNINASLDQVEDPQKLVRMRVREMEDALIALKAACAGVMIDSQNIEHRLQLARKRAGDWENRAQAAVHRGRDDLAREALLEKRRCLHSCQALKKELNARKGLLVRYQDERRQLEEKLNRAREKERVLVQRYIYADRKKRAQQGIRRIDGSEAVFKFNKLETRIQQMESEFEGADPGRQPLEAALEKLGRDEQIEGELKVLKAACVDQMEKRVAALETIVGDSRKGIHHA
jgi:phage shock protein A